MSASAKRLKLRLFLEGIEVPVIAARVESAPNSPGVCSIQVPPVAAGTELLPRTLVHLFFFDERQNSVTEGAAPRPRRAQEPGDEIGDEIGDDIAAELDPESYRLLFAGEVVGFRWSKASHQRALVLQCFDFSNYWDAAYQWSNRDVFGPGHRAVFMGASTNLFTSLLTTKGEDITAIVSSGRCRSFPELRGLAAGIVRLIEAIGGYYYGEHSFSGQNTFFSLAELRLHLSHMVAAYERDPTSSRLLRRHGYGSLFNRLLGGQGQQTSIRQCITALSRIIFHETYPQPCPYLDRGVGRSRGGPAQLPRLNQQIFRPDIWFGAPPRSNVLFPDDYERLEYSRNFLDEPTRLLLKTHDEFFGEDYLFDTFYFAPSGNTSGANRDELLGVLRRRTLDHELFTGILPMYEKMGEFNVYASRSVGEDKKSSGKIGLAQRSANFLYFKHRFNARRLQVEARFRPHVAVGFPGLLLDRDADSKGGAHFLGNFTRVVHSVSQADARGGTNITCSYPRQPGEAVEFLGVTPTKMVRRQTGTVSRSTEVKRDVPPELGDKGPAGGRVTAVETLIGASPRYRVTEEVPIYRREAAELSMEDVLRPGWYGDVWSSERIGDVYRSFFGIGAITDEHREVSGGQGSTESLIEEGGTLERAVRALAELYHRVRTESANVDDFITSYTWREIASLTDMLGSADLVMSEDGGSVVQGTEGFHSRAFGPYEDVTGLVGPEIQNILGVKRESPEARKLDARKRKYDAVLAYAEALRPGTPHLG